MRCRFTRGCFLYKRKKQDECFYPQYQRNCWLYKQFDNDVTKYLFSVKALEHVEKDESKSPTIGDSDDV